MASVEHEYKFLVVNHSWQSDIIEKESIKQGYIADIESGVIRVRLINDIGWLGIKCSINMTSAREFEYIIPSEDAEELMRLPGVIGRIMKTRYILNNGWIIDAFEGRLSGLVIAEIELDSADEAFELPSWAGKDITHDVRYRNRQLAVAGLPR